MKAESTNGHIFYVYIDNSTGCLDCQNEGALELPPVTHVIEEKIDELPLPVILKRFVELYAPYTK